MSREEAPGKEGKLDEYRTHTARAAHDNAQGQHKTIYRDLMARNPCTHSGEHAPQPAANKTSWRQCFTCIDVLPPVAFCQRQGRT